MRLAELLSSLPNFEPHGNLDIEISAIADDSRKVQEGSLFVAIKGLTVDSHNFIPQAIQNGAVAIIGEEPIAELSLQLENISYIQVSNSRHALGILASAWFGHPSNKLRVIGVTGTEGKTTTCNLIYHILNSAGKKAGLVSTINAKIGNKIVDTGLHVTNPEALPLQELLTEMVKANCEFAVLETTSMGLHQGRVAGVGYEIGVLTNFAQDHLDYHKTQDAYREAKAMLFQKVKAAILNKDDESFEYFSSQVAKEAKIVTYGLEKNSDIKAENIQQSTSGVKFSIYSKGQEIEINSQILGKYNVLNMLAASGACLGLGLAWHDIKPALESFTSPEGRLEKIDQGQNFSVFVDFAHTPNSLEKTLSTLREVLAKGKRLIAVYGAAGERDALKRPAMGRAARLANLTIFTADDPRSEEVLDIISQMEQGARKAGVKHISLEQIQNNDSKQSLYSIEPDRRDAISLALQAADEGDIVSILGKGHEKSLAVKGEEIPWSDQEIIRQILRELGN